MIIRRREIPEHAGDGWPASVPPLLRRVLAARGVRDPGTAQLRLAHLLAPDALGGIEQAAALIRAAIATGRRIVIVGDFDCDGATGTALAVRGLRMLGARDVVFRVPNRSLHGYGLTPALVAEIAVLAPALLITVDAGIACIAGVEAARARGFSVIVTDHHLPGATLPAADAIVNPNVPGDAFASKALAGVGVMFYLLLAVRRQMRDAGEPGAGADLTALLDLVAIGTVADMVRLDANNRILVRAGLARIRRGRMQPGVAALIAAAGKSAMHLGASDIGFALAPRINAAGRLEDMAIGIACLLSDDPHEARALAAQLDAINAERRALQTQMLDEAERLAAALSLDAATLPVGVCLADPGWHPGVVGLVASRIKDQVHRPTIALAPAQADDPDGEWRGSARSVPGFHIRDALALVDARYPGLLLRFGGHAMAAGLSMAGAAVPRLAPAFAECVREHIDPALLVREIETDGPLYADEYDLANALAIERHGPWGQGFPEPQFDAEFDLLDWRLLGERHLRVELLPAGADAPVSGIHFDAWRGEPPPARVRAVFQLAVNRFRGRASLQLLLRHWQAA